MTFSAAQSKPIKTYFASILTMLSLTVTSCMYHHDYDYKLPDRSAHLMASRAGMGVALGSITGANVPLAFAATGLAGNLSGSFMQTRYSLIHRLQSAGIQVVEYGDHLVVVIPSDSFFDIDGNALNPDRYTNMIEIAQLAKMYSNSPILIAAYTDNVGDANFRKQQSKTQAEAILGFFWAHGLDQRKMRAYGFGSQHDVADNQTVLGSGLNRRVEIHLNTQASA